MTDTAALFKKLNLGSHTSVLILNAPASFNSHVDALTRTSVQVSAKVRKPVGFALAFVITQAELDAVSSRLVAAAAGDAILWMCYPKGTSKRYQCEFNRDSGWQVLGEAGFEPVRMVAIDEDWSALRFRKVEHIKTMTRETSRTHSKQGRSKVRK